MLAFKEMRIATRVDDKLNSSVPALSRDEPAESINNIFLIKSGGSFGGSPWGKIGPFPQGCLLKPARSPAGGGNQHDFAGLSEDVPWRRQGESWQSLLRRITVGKWEDERTHFLFVIRTGAARV
jgi:hypothetical protein